MRGVWASARPAGAKGQYLKGMTIVLTGRFERYNRSQAEELLRDPRGRVDADRLAVALDGQLALLGVALAGLQVVDEAVEEVQVGIARIQLQGLVDGVRDEDGRLAVLADHQLSQLVDQSGELGDRQRFDPGLGVTNRGHLDPEDTCGEFAVYTKVHHALADGATAMRLLTPGSMPGVRHSDVTQPCVFIRCNAG